MRTNIFYVSDTHFSHWGVCKFLDDFGNKIRPWDNPDEMDEALVKNWNSVVRPNDKVYHLGDVAINRRGLNVVDRLNGKKCLIKGNHDLFSLENYVGRFYDIRAYDKHEGIFLSHVPMHVGSLGRGSVNVHGHLHQNRVLDHSGEIDKRYFSVCVEKINFTPIERSELFKMIEKQGGEWRDYRKIGG